MSLISALNIIFASSTVFDVLRTTEKYDKNSLLSADSNRQK